MKSLESPSYTNSSISEACNNSIVINQQDKYEKINQIFEEKDQQERTIQEAREILGESASNLTDEQVFDLVNEVQFLVDSWLEEYERKVFDGKSLDELLQLDKI